MNFDKLEPDIQKSLIELLNEHITLTEDILKKYKCLLPMLMIPDTKQLVSLQPQNGQSAPAKAYEAVIRMLKKQSFWSIVRYARTNICHS